MPSRARASWACSWSDRGLARMTAMPHQRSRTASAGARSYSASARAVAWANSASNCAHSPGDSWASAARTAGPDRSILVVAVVIAPVSRRPAARERSARRPAVADPWAVDEPRKHGDFSRPLLLANEGEGGPVVDLAESGAHGLDRPG